MLLVKLIEPPLAEPHERWCERSGDWLNLPPTRFVHKESGKKNGKVYAIPRLCIKMVANRKLAHSLQSRLLRIKWLLKERMGCSRRDLYVVSQFALSGFQICV